MNYIKIEDCKDGWFYRICARNFSYGVYSGRYQGFIGIREKYDRLYLSTEFHWDTGPPCGTVLPEECLEQCPIKPLEEGKFEEKDGKTIYVDNQALFDWLEIKIEEWKPRHEFRITASRLPEKESKNK